MVGIPGLSELTGVAGEVVGQTVGGIQTGLGLGVDEETFSGEQFNALEGQLAAAQAAPPSADVGAARGLLLQQATGQAPSAAALQGNQNLANVASTQRSQAASAQGVNPALRQAIAAQNIGQSQQTAAGQSAVLQAQEQAQAQQSLAQFELQNEARVQQATQFFLQQGFDIASAKQQAEIALAQQQAAEQGAIVSALGGVASSAAG